MELDNVHVMQSIWQGCRMQVIQPISGHTYPFKIIMYKNPSFSTIIFSLYPIDNIRWFFCSGISMIAGRFTDETQNGILDHTTWIGCPCWYYKSNYPILLLYLTKTHLVMKGPWDNLVCFYQLQHETDICRYWEDDKHI